MIEFYSGRYMNNKKLVSFFITILGIIVSLSSAILPRETFFIVFVFTVISIIISSKNKKALIFICLALCSSQISINVSDFKVSFAEILIPLILVYTFLRKISHRTVTQEYTLNKIYMSTLFIFVILVSLSIIKSENIVYTVKGIYQYFEYLVLLYFVVIFLMNFIKEKEDIFLLITNTGVVFSIFGIIQWIVFMFFDFDILKFLTQSPWVGKSGLTVRISSLFEHYNAFTTYLIIPFFLSYYFYQKSKSPLGFIKLNLITVALVLSNSRSAIVATLIALFFTLVLMKKWKSVYSNLLILSAILVAILLINPSLILDRFVINLDTEVSDVEWSVIHRKLLWDAAYQMYEKNKMTGVGLGNFQFRVEEYGVQDVTADSTYYTMLAESGLFGISGFFLVMLFVILRLLKSKEEVDKILLGIIVAELLNAILQPPFIFMRGVGFAFWFIIHLSTIDSNKYRSEI